jgi:serine/threonine protein kinase
MAHADAARDLLFGLLALQTGLINQAQLVAAFHAWTQARDRTMAEILAEQGALATNCLTLVEAFVLEHLRRHGSDPERSLAALGVGRSTRECLAGIGNRELDASLAQVGSGSTEQESDPDRTATYAVGSTTSDGQRFRVLRPHAQGGLGAVFVALDSELHREVALKQILESHADDPASRQRFILEAEVTGGLEHPGIVPVYGLGTYGDGRPYYAMRFIRGDSLKQAIEHFHADEALKNDPGRRSLELRQLLRRFTDVCHAIDYARSRGVLHRDIKPGNVIVGKHGETLVVDWGLAKAMGKADPSSGERTLMPTTASGSAETLPGSALGTPAYMSPEQAEGDLGKLGPRSDVYSLGATLYCLLTGGPPFVGDPMEVIPRVQRGDFRPPRQLDPTVDRALEAICLKAMALRPEDRYGSCRALAEDSERWMADEPVSAWREPWIRRARRWARRHRTAVTGAAAAVLAGLIGLAAVAVVQSRSNRELRVANAKTSRALAAETKAKNDTTEALGQSEEARKRAEAVLGFLKNDVLAAARPEGQEGGLGVEVTVRRAVDAAEPKIAGAFQDQPIVEADVRDTLGTTYYYLGEAPLAIPQFERAVELYQTRLGPDHPSTLTSRDNLASAYLAAGRTAEAIALYEANLKLYESKLGPDHPSTLASRSNLANTYQDAGRSADALTLHEATLKLSESKLGPDHPSTLTSRNGLAVAYLAAGRTAEALTIFEATLKLYESKLGPDHPHTLISRGNLAKAYQAAGQLDRAVALLEQTLIGFRAKVGPDHPYTLTTEQLLGIAYTAAGQYTKAEPLLRDGLERARKQFGSADPRTAGAMAQLGLSLIQQRKWPEAETILRECLAIREKAQPDDWSTFNTRSQLGGSLLGQKKYAEAEPLILSGYEGLKVRQAKIPAPDKPRLAEAAERVVPLYEAWGKRDKAAEWRAKLARPSHPTR